ncbi:pentapeptide repeat-containing protein [Actinomadura chibensis]|uniref:Pentapeptide repeat-containing protein n=1 Tax=Actinomadura chibensis TaxID=392828 RepID=A0A5D0NHL5_9ACTN|nr:pentapeptide repeat-containing protein [Actinomadura chibensis]
MPVGDEKALVPPSYYDPTSADTSQRAGVDLDAVFQVIGTRPKETPAITVLERTDLTRVTAQSANLYLATFQGAHLESARFQRARLFQADLRNTISCNASFSNADMREASMSNAFFDGAAFDATNLIKAFLHRTSMKRANTPAVDRDLAGRGGGYGDGSISDRVRRSPAGTLRPWITRKYCSSADGPGSARPRWGGRSRRCCVPRRFPMRSSTVTSWGRCIRHRRGTPTVRRSPRGA